MRSAAARSSGARDNIFKNYLVARGDVDAAMASARRRRRGRVRDRRAGAALHRAERHDRDGERRRRRHGLGLDAVPVLHPQGAAALFDLPADKVRVVQMETGGGFGGKEEYPSIIACHAALLAWKSGQPGEARLRPRRGHGGDDQAPPVADAPPDGGDARRTPRGDGRRLRHRRRRVLHAVAGRAVARHDSRRRDRTCARTCACAGGPWRPTRRRTARSAASARRRASSRSSGTWTASPPPSAWRRTSCGGATSFAPATRAPSAR